MDPVSLQKQIRDNAQDVNQFYNELLSWGQEIKEKDQSIKQHKEEKKRVKFECDGKKVKKKVYKKVGSTDYSAWDKFDVEAECEKIDYNENEESDLTDECDENVREEALLEKEKGNKFVKQNKWNEAVKCYTKAINLYSFDPIFYANRALCFLKNKDYAKAESDCTMSLKLDKTYVKAYQRRAAAKEALGMFKEAEQDLLKVIELEPNNKESRKCLDELRKKVTPVEPKMVSKFSASRNQLKINKTHKTEDTLMLAKFTDEDVIVVRPVNKPPHLRSKLPLQRIETLESDNVNNQNIVEKEKLDITAVKPLVIEKHEMNSQEDSNKIKDQFNLTQKIETMFVLPKTSIQFYGVWKHLNDEQKNKYLLLIKPNEIENIFKESLESNVFSDILNILATYFENNREVYDWLFYLSKIKRFSTFVMFMSDTDKKNLWKLVDSIKCKDENTKEEVAHIINLYEL